MTKTRAAGTTGVDVDKAGSLRIVDKDRSSALRHSGFKLAAVPLDSAAIVLVEAVAQNDARPTRVVDVRAFEARSTSVNLEVPAFDIQRGSKNAELRMGTLVSRKFQCVSGVVNGVGLGDSETIDPGLNGGRVVGGPVALYTNVTGVDVGFHL